ncbi:hypothetical protein Goshw_024237 [Gossypium schwendimanii]|uniref:Uncharacterized protein n=1 Tax=Gossypium schwendimanii TaxID=34291 RepID=A0A7J9KNL6_GOSSC|nr:hypothetical protein [Gossypium schwendimanii]
MISRFIQEINYLGEIVLTKKCLVSEWSPPNNQTIKINFDSTYDPHQIRSALGLVARNDRREVLVSKSTLNKEVASFFAAEAPAYSKAVRLRISMGVEMVEIKRQCINNNKEKRFTKKDLCLYTPWNRWDLGDRWKESLTELVLRAIETTKRTIEGENLGSKNRALLGTRTDNKGNENFGKWRGSRGAHGPPGSTAHQNIGGFG